MFQPCGCPEARLLRELLAVANEDGPVNLPDGPLWAAIEHMADVVAIRALRSMSHDLGGANDWGASAQRAPYRADPPYDQPARSAEQIRREAAASWEDGKTA